MIALTTTENFAALAVVAAYLAVLVAAFRRADWKLNKNEHEQEENE